jgi:hypothetical protein
MFKGPARTHSAALAAAEAAAAVAAAAAAASLYVAQRCSKGVQHSIGGGGSSGSVASMWCSATIAEHISMWRNQTPQTLPQVLPGACVPAGVPARSCCSCRSS